MTRRLKTILLVMMAGAAMSAGCRTADAKVPAAAAPPAATKAPAGEDALSRLRAWMPDKVQKGSNVFQYARRIIRIPWEVSCRNSDDVSQEKRS